MTAPVKRSIQLNIIIAIYFLVSLVIGFSAILFGLQNRMNIDLVENIVVIALLLTSLLLSCLYYFLFTVKSYGIILIRCSTKISHEFGPIKINIKQLIWFLND